MPEEHEGFEAQRVATFQHALENGDPGLLPVCFQMEVLDRYLSRQGCSGARTENAGMLVCGRLQVDFGIVDAERLIHLTWSDFLHKVPASERGHWLAYLVTPPLNAKFLRMRLRPTCVDDGDIRPMSAGPRSGTESG